jgi:pteridine reductase
MAETDAKPFEIKGRVALITGAARRVGRGVCLALADAGFLIAIHHRESKKDAEELLAQITAKHGSGSARLFQADLADEKELADLPHRVHREFGRLDLLVNNASVFHKTPLAQLNKAAIEEFHTIHVLAPALLSAESAQYLKAGKPGHIINMVDVYARFTKKDYLAYTVSKAGLEALTRQLAVELAPDILVNAISPGAILEPVDGAGPETRDKILARIPLGRFGEPEDIAKAVLFLAGSDYITGQTIVIDGGRSLTI